MNKLLKTRGARAATAPTPGATHRPRRILVVDDDTGIRQLGTEVLIRHGYQVDAAEGNTAGWKALQSRSYDLLITDLDMPGLSGLKLVKQLRAARMALPVILASGTMTPQELNRNPWLQLSGALLKPFPPDQLLQTVQAVLRATVSARSPREILLAAGSSGSAPPISRGGQIAPPPNWQSQPSVEGLQL
jgi:DNA-binding response OmpR family regulator